MSSIRVILFDLDETLFDHRHASRSGLEALRAAHASIREWSLGQLEAEAQQILRRTHVEVLAGRLTPAQARLRRLSLLLESCGTTPDSDEILRMAQCYRRAYEASRRPTEGVIQLLERLGTRYRLGIVTNHLQREQEAKLAKCGLDTRIDFMVTAEKTGHAKPAPEIFAAAVASGGASSASEAVMVGDSWEADILGALNFGMRAVWYNPQHHACPDPHRVAQLTSFLPTHVAWDTIAGQ